ncbi:MAG: glycosyltransferase family 4 protein [Gemmatimonadaceae bacterium]
MRVVFVCDEYPPGPHGGIGTMVRTLARGLVASGHEVRVLGSYAHDYPAPDYEVDAGVHVWRARVPRGPLGWVRARLALRARVLHWCRGGLADVVEVADWGGAAARWPRLPVPVVARLHGSATFFAAEMGRTVDRRSRMLEWSSLHRADYWASTSRYTADRTRALFDLPTDADAVLPNAVAVPPRSVKRRSPNRVVFTGTLTAKKGVRSLVEAWPLVLSSVPDAELHLYGKDSRSDHGGGMRDELCSRLPAAAADHVRFHGHVGAGEVLAALDDARAAVFPSYAEAFAHAPMEAMATGCPTVYTLRGSGRELITPEVDGLLVDPDDRMAIAAALVRLLTDDSLARRLGDAGRRTVAERFSVERMVAMSTQFYAGCAERFRAREAAGASGARGRRHALAS